MYKPDPRLPPDQQMLPTHAKRLQQEQWDAARKESEIRQRELGNTEAKERTRSSSEELDLDRAAIGNIDMNSSNQSPTRRGGGGGGFPSPLAMHTRSGLLPSRDGTTTANDERLDREREKERTRKSLDHARNLEERERQSERDRDRDRDRMGTEKRSPTGTYSPLPPLPPTRQDGGVGGASATTGLRKESRVAVDPFEKEKVGRMREQEEEKRRRGSRGGRGEKGEGEGEFKEGGKEKEVGCTCCVVM